MEPWAVDILQFLGGGLVTLAVGWIAARVQAKAAATQARQVEITAYLEVGDKWKEWAKDLEARMEESEKEVAKLRPLFNSAIRHIVELRLLIVSLGFGEHLLPLPGDIAHLIEEDKKE